MEETYISAITDLGVSLTTLAVKGTASAINAKIKSIKNERNLENVKNSYDEIINELLSEREEAVRIAQAYKTELDRIIISDEDIKHLHNTVSKVLNLLKNMQLLSVSNKSEEEKNKVKEQVATYEQIKELISVDTLKTMQLLGFNYKAAIGEPLTVICANAITSLGGKENNKTKKK